MADKIQLEVYAFNLRKSGEEEFINLGNFYRSPEGETSTFLETFMRFSDGLVNMKVDQVTSRTFQIQEGSLRLNDDRISGIFKYGSFGYAADLININNVNGIDPEINTKGVSVAQGVEYFTNPQSKGFLFSLTINY